MVLSSATISTYSLLGNKLSSIEAYTILSTFQILSCSFLDFPENLAGIFYGFSGLASIQNFLNATCPQTKMMNEPSEEKSNEDQKGISFEDLNLTQESVKLVDIGEKSQNSKTMLQIESEPFIQIINGNFSYTLANLRPSIQIQQTKSDLSAETEASFLQDNPQESCFQLRNLSMNFQKASLSAIIGKVGSGKSSIFKAILGDLPASNSKHPIEMNGSIAYVSQHPWLFAGTIKDNICFGKEYNEDLLLNCIKFVALAEDIAVFPDGLNSYIGEQGVNLSGGQKMRLSLARAIYSKADIYLLDDIFAPIDPHLISLIFENCVIKFLRDKIRIIITNNVNLLSRADYIYYIEEGKIAFEGKYEAICSFDAVSLFLQNARLPEKKQEIIIPEDSTHNFSQNQRQKTNQNINSSKQLIEERSDKQEIS